MFRFSERSKRRMDGVDLELVAVANRAIQITKIDFGIPEFGGLRTETQQQELFRRGVTQCDGIIQKSKHQSGLALDVYAYVDGKASWEPEHLAMVAAAMLKAANELCVCLEWGGLWSDFVDMPHFEVVK